MINNTNNSIEYNDLYAIKWKDRYIAFCAKKGEIGWFELSKEPLYIFTLEQAKELIEGKHLESKYIYNVTLVSKNGNTQNHNPIVKSNKFKNCGFKVSVKI